MHDLFSQAVFGDHPLGRPVIGTADVISTVGRHAGRTNGTMYAPGNIVFAAAGNLKHEDRCRERTEQSVTDAPA